MLFPEILPDTWDLAQPVHMDQVKCCWSIKRYISVSEWLICLLINCDSKTWSWYCLWDGKIWIKVTYMCDFSFLKSAVKYSCWDPHDQWLLPVSPRSNTPWFHWFRLHRVVFFYNHIIAIKINKCCTLYSATLGSFLSVKGLEKSQSITKTHEWYIMTNYLWPCLSGWSVYRHASSILSSANQLTTVSIASLNSTPLLNGVTLDTVTPGYSAWFPEIKVLFTIQNLAGSSIIVANFEITWYICLVEQKQKTRHFSALSL